MWSPHERTLGVNIGTALGQLDGDEDSLVNAVADFALARLRAGWRIEWFVVWPRDLPMVLEVCRRAGLSGQVIHEIYDDADRYLNTVCRMRAFVGMKLHSVALALCAGVPSMSLAYEPKCLDFMEPLGLGELAITTDKALSGNAIEELARGLEENGAAISIQALERLSAFSCLQKERSSQLVQSIGAGLAMG
jgi:polysaccharide pyruvyl transferase WcaK-like protein